MKSLRERNRGTGPGRRSASFRDAIPSVFEGEKEPQR